MAARRFVQFQYSLEAKVCHLFAKATIGAAGAITLDKTGTNSKGFASITKQATAGQYIVKMQDPYAKILNVHSRIMNATGIAASGALGLLSTTNTQAAGGASIVIQFSNAGTATNLASGDVLFLEFTFGDSSV